jgi:dienelactone hydrolase
VAADSVASMPHIALFHSVLGNRPGLGQAAAVLRSAGHDVDIIDQYDGRMFDSYEEAGAFAQSVGYPVLMQRAVELVAGLPTDVVYAGFSNGGGMSAYVATQRPGARGVLMLSGAADPAILGLGDTLWPAGVPAQIHYTYGDPFRSDDSIAAVRAWLRAADAPLEQYDYVGSGHLFTDESLPAEYEPGNAAALWPRVLEFLRTLG